MNCDHSRYHDGKHMTGKKIARLTKSRGHDICWTSPTITHCEDCGADISEFDVHKVITAKEYVEANVPQDLREKMKRERASDLAHKKSLQIQEKAKRAGQGSLL